jgi:SWI/SNF-related matrix-associated actin-dependent regulator of chromatin subfamily A3
VNAVSPLSVLSNWEEQIVVHCVPGTLSTCVYYGSNKTLSADELKNYDVVITTYQTVAGEFGSVVDEAGGRKKRKTEQNLFDVNWKVITQLEFRFLVYANRILNIQRIVLDEGHNIRNPKTKMAKSVCALRAERRWVLSGTPIVSPATLLNILPDIRSSDQFPKGNSKI